MAGLGQFLPNISGTSILNGVFWTLAAIIAIAAVGGFTWFIIVKRKYSQYSVEILDKDSNGNVYRTYDRAGVFYSKKVNKMLLWLEKAKVGLGPNKIPYISHKDKKGRLVKVITLKKIGEGKYVFVEIKLGDTIHPAEYTVGEEDLNNAHAEMIKVRRLTNKESWLSKLAPFIAIVIMMIVMMVLGIMLLNKFGAIEKAANSLDSASSTQERIAELQYNTTMILINNRPTGPIVTPGGIR